MKTHLPIFCPAVRCVPSVCAWLATDAVATHAAGWLLRYEAASNIGINRSALAKEPAHQGAIANERPGERSILHTIQPAIGDLIPRAAKATRSLPRFPGHLA